MKKLFLLPLVLILAVGVSACSEDVTVGSGASDTGSSSESKPEATNSKNKEKPISKKTAIHFSDTSAQQTTKVDRAEIKKVSDLNLVDNEFDAVDYALLIHMSVSNKAPQSAQTYPSQGHVVLDDGTQVDGLIGADVDIDDAFKDGDIAHGATVLGYVIFPLKEEQAKKFKKGSFKFDVMAGDDMFTEKNYSVNIEF
ncbi:hypothetical protein EWH99_12620 [Sporolactobacillus sp. THM7-7]|nr:hypothetical protein EWH99_12620 [Sporolactobacillus sp. THM7-7]